MPGAVFDLCHREFQDDLRTDLSVRRLDSILDTGMMELATLAGHTSDRVRRLPWANNEPHRPSDFDIRKCDEVADQIARVVSEYNFSAVLAPSHFLADGGKDVWFEIDKRVTRRLRMNLNSIGKRDVSIYYPLAIPTKTFFSASARIELMASLAAMPIDALWLRIHPFGSTSGDLSLRRYIEACQSFHALKRPLVAEKTGVLGLALLAFGAVSGLETGISSGEKFDFGRLKRGEVRKEKFGRTIRIYLPDFGAFLTKKEAEEFFLHRGLRKYACRDTACCRRGHESMLQDYRRHFGSTRMHEIELLNKITPSLQPSGYLEQFLRQSTDKIGRAIGNDHLSSVIKDKLLKSRQRQDGWRATLGELSQRPLPTYCPPIERRIHRESVIA